MTIRFFDLGLSEEDERAMREARLGRFVVDREAALRLARRSADPQSRDGARCRRRPHQAADHRRGVLASRC